MQHGQPIIKMEIKEINTDKKIYILFTLNQQMHKLFFISNFRPVLNVVCFLLGNSPASEFYMPAFRNAVCSMFIGG